MFCFKNRFSPPHHIFILKKDLNAAFIDELAPFSAYLGSHIAKNHKQNTNFQGRKWDCSFKEQIHVLAHKTSKKSIIWDTNWILKRFWPLSCKKIWFISNWQISSYLSTSFMVLCFVYAKKFTIFHVLARHYGWTDGPINQPTDRQTNPHIEMRGCI